MKKLTLIIAALILALTACNQQETQQENTNQNPPKMKT